VTEEPEYVTVGAIALRLGVNPSVIWTALCRHKSEFGSPVYRRENGHPRRIRVLTRKEESHVCALLGFR
jgi:hypothetical protein